MMFDCGQRSRDELVPTGIIVGNKLVTAYAIVLMNLHDLLLIFHLITSIACTVIVHLYEYDKNGLNDGLVPPPHMLKIETNEVIHRRRARDIASGK